MGNGLGGLPRSHSDRCGTENLFQRKNLCERARSVRPSDEGAHQCCLNPEAADQLFQPRRLLLQIRARAQR